MPFFSSTIIPTTAIKTILSNKSGLRGVKQININLRSLGDATYVAIGGSDAQSRRLVAVGDNISISPVANELYIDVNSIFIISDGTTPVVEIFGECSAVGPRVAGGSSSSGGGGGGGGAG